jgi:hypothetical protein
MPAAMPCFTLVGIAGEDDVDAPDLTQPLPEAEKLRTNSKIKGNGTRHARLRRGAAQGGANKSIFNSVYTELSAALSASLAAELLRQIEELNSADEAAAWAHHGLAAKNQLSTADARQVEEAFTGQIGGAPDGKSRNQ